MAAINVPDSRDNSLTLPPSEKSTSEKSVQQKICQGTAKNSTSVPTHVPAPAPPVINKQTADQIFHDASSETIPDSQMQNEVANLERQVLETKKVVLQKQLRAFTAANYPVFPTQNSVI